MTVYYKCKKANKFMSLDSRFVDLENAGLRATLSCRATLL